MDIFSFLSLFGGLAIFLYGMNAMGDALERSSAGKLKSFLGNVTKNPLGAVLLGAGVTAIIQSSSATTVMVVGFINSGIMELGQSIGIIMGANIGTTITSWILSLSGIQSDNVFIQLIKAQNLAFLVSVVGIVLIMMSKNDKKKDIGTIFLGFAMIMVGMDIMSGAVEPLKNNEQFHQILLLFENPLLGVLMGAVLTAIIQSSSASVGILQALSVSVSISYGSAIPIILGQNIGTCVTAVLSAIGANKNAKRAAAIHLSFNIIGTLVFLILFYIVKFVFNPAIFGESVNGAGIAVVHTLFNVTSTVVMFPFIKQLEKLAYVLIRPEKQKEEKTELLDERLLVTPPVAIAQATRVTHEMADIAKNSLIDSLSLIFDYDNAKAKRIYEDEKAVDRYEDKIGTYLVKLSRESLSIVDSHEASNLLHTIGDFERISDHAINIVDVAKEIHEKGIVFTDKAVKEMKVLIAALSEILDNTVAAFQNDDIELAKRIEPLEQVIDKIRFILKQRHIERLQNNECTIETGFVFSDFITNCERVADHCSNIGVCLIQVAKDRFDTHQYLKNVKESHNEVFENMYNKYEAKYSI
ncbi:MAG: Na/Pi cotransporter family protein [Clostridia bacterium]|nr:Na/Pi cotransporter family protein [Clostridia bacterium]